MSPIVVTILQDQCMVYKNEINDVIMTLSPYLSPYLLLM